MPYEQVLGDAGNEKLMAQRLMEGQPSADWLGVSGGRQEKWHDVVYVIYNIMYTTFMCIYNL